MGPNDVEAVARILTAAFDLRSSAAAPGLSVPSVQISPELVQRWQVGCTASWVALRSGYGPIGAAFGVVEPHIAWMAGLGVDPRFRRLGVGTALADTALTFLRGKHRCLVGLEAFPYATDALAMYGRRGFVPVDLTIRLRVPVTSLPAVLSGAELDQVSIPRGDLDKELAGADGTGEIVRTIEANPLSSSAFALFDVGDPSATFIVCEPEPSFPLLGGGLEIRLAWISPSRRDSDVVAIIHAVAVRARDLNYRNIEIDVPLTAGGMIGSLLRVGLSPIATMLRMTDDPIAYPAVRTKSHVVGRWSL